MFEKKKKHKLQRGTKINKYVKQKKTKESDGGLAVKKGPFRLNVDSEVHFHIVHPSSSTESPLTRQQPPP